MPPGRRWHSLEQLLRNGRQDGGSGSGSEPVSAWVIVIILIVMKTAKESATDMRCVCFCFFFIILLQVCLVDCEIVDERDCQTHCCQYTTTSWIGKEKRRIWMPISAPLDSTKEGTIWRLPEKENRLQRCKRVYTRPLPHTHIRLPVLELENKNWGANVWLHVSLVANSSFYASFSSLVARAPKKPVSALYHWYFSS